MDHASLVLLRSVMDDAWRPEQAARELLATVREDRATLRILRARVARVLLERPSGIAERANRTLDLAFTPGHASGAPRPFLPRQGGNLV